MISLDTFFSMPVVPRWSLMPRPGRKKAMDLQASAGELDSLRGPSPPERAVCSSRIVALTIVSPLVTPSGRRSENGGTRRWFHGVFGFLWVSRFLPRCSWSPSPGMVTSTCESSLLYFGGLRRIPEWVAVAEARRLVQRLPLTNAAPTVSNGGSSSLSKSVHEVDGREVEIRSRRSRLSRKVCFPGKGDPARPPQPQGLVGILDKLEVLSSSRFKHHAEVDDRSDHRRVCDFPSFLNSRAQFNGTLGTVLQNICRTQPVVFVAALLRVLAFLEKHYVRPTRRSHGNQGRKTERRESRARSAISARSFLPSLWKDAHFDKANVWPLWGSWRWSSTRRDTFSCAFTSRHRHHASRAAT